ncbi:MAG: hypothetical protein V4710_16015 [Verrucomicrobiota bacterium]
MDAICLDLKRLESGEELTIDGIVFSQCVLIRIHINGGSFDSLEVFPDSLAVFSELERSLAGSGLYLLFSCACGMADDGGWDYVRVTHAESTITWSFHRDRAYLFRFKKDLYRMAIAECAKQIDLLDPEMPVEPAFIVYPEE